MKVFLGLEIILPSASTIPEIKEGLTDSDFVGTAFYSHDEFSLERLFDWVDYFEFLFHKL